MGNFINNLIDNLLSVTWRLLDLPLYALFVGVLVLFLVLNWLAKRWSHRISDHKRRYLNLFLIVLILVFIVDKKLDMMRSEMNFLNEKIRSVQMAGAPIINVNPMDTRALQSAFPSAELKQRPVNEAIQLLTFSQKNPNAVCFVARIDLNHPEVDIQITPEKREKYLTSTFAEQNNCVIAINGEAGETMAMDCELGEWSGNWVSDGKVVMMADSDKRPFIGFTAQNKATYYEEAFVDTDYKDAYFNAIWGRFDILKKGQLVTHDNDKPYARTVMGLSDDSNYLFLMVVDGKRPDYSAGLTYSDCARVLAALGASDAMACDQGGSSCMYVRNMGGIINRPADSDGIERPIYSHFGVAMR